MAELIQKEKNIIELNVEIPANTFVEAMKETYKKKASQYSVPGFRKGKAPYNMVVRTYGEGNFYEGAIDLLANKAYKEALEEHKLEPVTRPSMDIKEIGSDKGLSLVFTVTTKPEVVLGQYLGLEVEKDKVELSEEDINNTIKKIQEKNARIISVEDRPAQMGDIANIDFEGFLDDKAFDGGKAEGHDLELGSKSFIPGFEEQVVGKTVGEDFDVNVSFPEDYHAEELKGKPVVFKCRLNSLKSKELPELDDEFAKDVSEYDTFAEYKESIVKKLEEDLVKKNNEKFLNDVANKAIENASVEIPQTMIEEEQERIASQQEQMMRYQGITLNQYLMYIGKTKEEFIASFSEQASKNIKSRLTLEAICEKEAVKATEEDFEKEYQRMAEQYKKTADEIRDIFADQKSYLEKDIAIQKTLELIEKSAVAI